MRTEIFVEILVTCQLGHHRTSKSTINILSSDEASSFSHQSGMLEKMLFSVEYRSKQLQDSVRSTL